MVIYLVSTVVSLALVFDPETTDNWKLAAAIASLVLVAWITVVNFLYLLCQIVMAADDIGVRDASRGSCV